jgi:mRNA interferase RelE/StbE
MYELIFDDKATDFLQQLPKPKRKQVFDAIVATKSNPHKYFTRLRSRTDNSFTIKNIRVIADIAERRKRIEVTLIEFRSRAYQKK